MVAAFLAAFMSTVGTQLNWGCSYLVNDLYKRFLVRNSTERHYVQVSRVITVLLVLVSGYTATQLKSIGAGLAAGAGCRVSALARFTFCAGTGGASAPGAKSRR